MKRKREGKAKEGKLETSAEGRSKEGRWCKGEKVEEGGRVEGV